MKVHFGTRVAGLGILLSIFPGSISGSEFGALLDAADIVLEHQDRMRGPALSSAIHDPKPWASYNHWACFDSRQVQVETSNIWLHNEWTPWPGLRFEIPGQILLFSPETDLPLEAATVAGAWREILQNSREVCIYAAFLQRFPAAKGAKRGTPESLWVLQKIKTENGSWSPPDTFDEDVDGEVVGQ